MNRKAKRAMRAKMRASGSWLVTATPIPNEQLAEDDREEAKAKIKAKGKDLALRAVRSLLKTSQNAGSWRVRLTSPQGGMWETRIEIDPPCFVIQDDVRAVVEGEYDA